MKKGKYMAEFNIDTLHEYKIPDLWEKARGPCADKAPLILLQVVIFEFASSFSAPFSFAMGSG